MSEQGQRVSVEELWSEDGRCLRKIGDGPWEWVITHDDKRPFVTPLDMAKAELSSLRAEVERLRQEVVDRDGIILGLQDVIGGRTKTIEQIRAELKQKFGGTL